MNEKCCAWQFYVWMLLLAPFWGMGCNTIDKYWKDWQEVDSRHTAIWQHYTKLMVSVGMPWLDGAQTSIWRGRGKKKYMEWYGGFCAAGKFEDRQDLLVGLMWSIVNYRKSPQRFWLAPFVFVVLAPLADAFLPRLPRKDQNYALPEFSKSKLWESQLDRMISHLSGRGALRARPSCPAHGLAPFGKRVVKAASRNSQRRPAQIAVRWSVQTLRNRDPAPTMGVHCQIVMILLPFVKTINHTKYPLFLILPEIQGSSISYTILFGLHLPLCVWPPVFL